MPTYLRADRKPVVQFEPRLEISPFVLFRRLREDRAPRLVDVRKEPREWTLDGAEDGRDEGWRPAAEDEEVLLFDRDGSRAFDLADRLQRQGFTRVKALFGGLELYRFSLDPEVVGTETFLVALEDD